ncbi:MAG: PEP-CTERM sorting domain-containing protein [Gemmatimonadetes bacterium]|nr:PEP-CTERM sorting domain-containing protein [Gemmatimonadota bacterium]
MHVLSRPRVALALVGASTLPAQVNTTGTWSNMVAPNDNSSPFWDHSSFDGTKCNIGFFLLYPAGGGFGTCQLEKPTAAFVNANAGRLGLSSSGAPNGSMLSQGAYSFAPGHYQIEFLGNIASYGPARGQELWAFGAGSSGPVPLQQFYAVAGGNSGLTTIFNVNMASAWFLGARDANLGNTWDYSNTSTTTSGWALFSSTQLAGQQGSLGDHMFAAFGDTPSGDQDYNDLIIEVTASAVTAVPEPASIVLVLSGLGGILLVGRRRR